MTVRRLLVIDPQNDFCDLPEELTGANRPALAVSGAHQDMVRLAGLVEQAGAKFQSVTVTLDSHPYLAVERTTFWLDEQGQEVAPFTEITLADFDSGKFTPRVQEHVGEVREMLQQLEAAGRYKLMAWPVHCVTGTWGHNIHAVLSQQLNAWELQSGRAVQKVLKGEYPFAEHYGIFEAETPLKDVASTRFNGALADFLTWNMTDKVELYVAGEASSHCVAASVEQLIRFRKGDASGIVLLTDCMSPVTGFEQKAADFISRVVAAGARLMTSQAAVEVLNG